MVDLSAVYHQVQIGNVKLGNGESVALQSMTNTDTRDIGSTVGQVIGLAEAGADMVRIAVPGMPEAQSMKKIVRAIREKGYSVPLIADVHFNPRIAELMAALVEKVRINPGNYTDKRTSADKEISEAGYQESLEKMASRADSLFRIAMEHGSALRIGVNHGSLSERIINRYGNGPLGMAMSAMEWIDIAEAKGFRSLVFSMKSSHVLIMTEATFILIQKMKEKGAVYPLHIGVTEAGSGLDGRVKSAAGIGALLQHGIGDTIRVSLTERPENEILFSRMLLKAIDSIRPEYSLITPERQLIYSHAVSDREQWVAEASAISGYEHIRSGLRDIVLQNPCFSDSENRELAAAIMQACRIKISKTEIISCPTCARTQYDIESIAEKVKEKFSHYPGLKIGVMGCIVNGPGEMADADYGIVGASGGYVAVYKGRERVGVVLPQEEGLDLLQQLIEKDLPDPGKSDC